MNKEATIPFGASDSELMHQEINIPKGFEATIEGNKIILKKKESDDKKIKNAIKAILNDTEPDIYNGLGVLKTDMLAWLEKQATPQMVEDAFLKGCNDTKKSFLKRKGAWSEEDEEMLKEIISDVKYEGYNNNLQAYSYRKINWLKSIKEKIK